jgi:hypothetical protein
MRRGMQRLLAIAFASLPLCVIALSPAQAAERECRPSLSNLWHCPGMGETRQPTKPVERACRPSLSNGYHCPGATTPSSSTSSTRASREPTINRTTQKSERSCRPSLSNGFHCPGQPSVPRHPTVAGEYTTEAQAFSHCPSATVVWLNQETGIYHYRGSHWYGNTKHGAYMCESDSVSAGMRAATNEHHP